MRYLRKVSIFFLFLIIACAKKDENPCDAPPVYSYLPSDSKTWMEFISFDSLVFKDSLGNIATFFKANNANNFSKNCNQYSEYTRTVYQSEYHCPYEFDFSIDATKSGYFFSLQTGKLMNKQVICYSSFYGDPQQLEQKFVDSVQIRNTWFFKVYVFSDDYRIVYFTKANGIVAFQQGSTLWVNP
jgi:hypothetical protein